MKVCEEHSSCCPSCGYRGEYFTPDRTLCPECGVSWDWSGETCIYCDRVPRSPEVKQRVKAVYKPKFSKRVQGGRTKKAKIYSPLEIKKLLGGVTMGRKYRSMSQARKCVSDYLESNSVVSAYDLAEKYGASVRRWSGILKEMANEGLLDARRVDRKLYYSIMGGDDAQKSNIGVVDDTLKEKEISLDVDKVNHKVIITIEVRVV